MAKRRKMQHGGKRPGAGRPRKDIIRYSITVPKELDGKIAAWCRTGEITRSHFFTIAARTFLEGWPDPNDFQEREE